VKALVTGAGGMLGRALVPALERGGHQVRALTHADADITKLAALERAAAEFRPDWVFHLAAFTKVDDCERQADHAFLVNGLGARNAALAAASVGASLVHVSTDYVFDGAKLSPYREYDDTGPLSVYGASKLAGERAVREVLPRHQIVRTSWLYGAGGPNFVDTILAKARAGDALKIVTDQRGAPTWTEDLADALVRLAVTGQYGTYHVTNDGFCTWHEFAVFFLAEAGIPTEVGTTDSLRFARPARRPANSTLSNLLYQQVTGHRLPDWQDAVRRYLHSRAAAASGAVKGEA
jgi:dTDP-4-dehydrorhamnose reductase